MLNHTATVTMFTAQSRSGAQVRNVLVVAVVAVQVLPGGGDGTQEERGGEQENEDTIAAAARRHLGQGEVLGGMSFVGVS